MKRVTGIGGIFFNANDPVALRAWYKRHWALMSSNGEALRSRGPTLRQSDKGNDRVVHRRR